MGGPHLGPKMLVSALQTSPLHFEFIGHLDPQQLARQLRHCDWRKVLVYVVSKSGQTVETLANLAVVVQWLRNLGCRTEDLKECLVFATDPSDSPLLELAQTWGVEVLEIPPSLGGRFSSLSPVGLLPALWANVEVGELWRGASCMRQDMLRSDGECDLSLSAFTLFELWRREGIDQTVIMPYTARLADFSAWFVQLWAESLGKKLDLQGRVVYSGLTPIAACGPADQHSQMQLFLEGPRDKCLVVVEVENLGHDFPLQNGGEIEMLRRLGPYSLGQLLRAELKGCLQALREAQRPYLHLILPNLQPASLGATVAYFEGLTVLMGEYFNIDPFVQPGVEAGKRHAFQFLKGF